MKRIGLLLFILFMGSWALAQPPVGFSYQAVVRDGDGHALINESVQLRIKLTGSTGSPVYYSEEHTTTSNAQGLVNVIIGQGGTPQGSLAEAPWGTEQVTLNVEMRQGSSGAFQPMGSQPLQAVPYSLYATESGKVSEVVSDPDADDEEPIFVVRNKEGKVVFAVYQSGVRVYVDDSDTKRPKGGFAVGGYSNVHYGKDEEVNFLMVTPDSTRVSFRENDDGDKRPKGGFAVGGYSGAHNYLNVTPSHTQISFADDGTKRPKGGFAVGGYSSSWGKEPQANYLTVTPDSTRVSFKEDDDGGKRPKGGFAVGGYSGAHSYLNVTPSHTQVSFDTDNTGKRPKGGFAVGGYSSSFGKSIDQNYFDITMDATGVINPAENRVLWYPQKNAFMAGRILVESPDEVGENSFAVGYESKSKGEYSQAMGYKAKALGNYSTAIGREAVANQTNSFAFGQDAKAQGQESYAIGRGAIALGEKSFAIGSVGVDSLSQATGNTQATGAYSVAVGLGAQSQGEGSFAIGLGTKAEDGYSVALGYKTLASEYYATAMGQSTTASGNSATAMGYLTKASGHYSTAMGGETEALGGYCIAMGHLTKASGYVSTALGYYSEASSSISTAMGYYTIASGYASTTMGYLSKASGSYTTAIGYNTQASGNHAIAMGYSSQASAGQSTAMGYFTKASGENSTAIGYHTEASGRSSTTMGLFTKANAYGMVAIGRYNAVVESSSSYLWQTNDPLFVIGNGSSDQNTSNAMTVLKSGRVGLQSETSPSYALQLPNSTAVGTGRAQANLWSTYSDTRVKSNQQPIQYGLAEVMRMVPKTYFHHNSATENGNIKIASEGKQEIGLVAQEMYDIVPEAVNKPENEQAELWGLSYEKLVPVLVKAMQEQQELLDNQSILIERQQQVIDLMQQEIELLKQK